MRPPEATLTSMGMKKTVWYDNIILGRDCKGDSGRGREEEGVGEHRDKRRMMCCSCIGMYERNLIGVE